MKHEPQLEKALSELKKATGISLEVNAGTPEEADFALAQIRCLTSAYREKYDKTHFLQGLMTGSVPTYDILNRAARLHIESELPRSLFLLETKNVLDDTVTEILKNLFPSQSRNLLVPLSECSLVILRPLKTTEQPEDIERLAHTIVDTLNAEALTPVQVAYSEKMDSLTVLADSFREASLALKVGKLFYSEQTVFSSRRQGVGRLIFGLPHELCENFLKEIFGEDIPAAFDEDLSAAVNKFFQNNLNIAETARQLHMHRNTLIYRLEQLEKRTGLDIRRFEDAMTFKIATMVINYLQKGKNLQ